MTQNIRTILSAIFDTPVISFSYLGEGFYARVYRVTVGTRPETHAVKLYRAGGLARSEAVTLDLMARAGLPVPQVRRVVERDGLHALILQDMPGVNLASVSQLNTHARAEIGEQIVAALLNQHALTHEGYGDVDGEEFYPVWHEYYYRKCGAMMESLDCAHTLQRLDHDFFRTVATAYAQFDRIFTQEPAAPSLIHGDFNASNLLIDPAAARLTAILDPMGSMWGDREIELFQLDESVGKEYELLERYRAHYPLSETFELKNAFYRTFAEANHYARLQLPQDEHLSAFGADLQAKLSAYELF